MLVDISAAIRRLLLAAMPLATMGCHLESADPALSGPLRPGGGVTCKKEIIPAQPGDRAVSFAFDSADPRWADLYESCVTTDHHCAQLCSQIAAAAPPISGTRTGCAIDCDLDGWTVATLSFNAGNGSVPGRRPPGYQPLAFDGPGTTLGAHFSACAEHEAASIPAFRLLASELAEHGAPAALVTRARLAMKEEARHFQLMRRLARRYGGRPPTRPSPAVPPRRPLTVVAAENAIEGCVRETFSAIAAGWQARTAADPAVRSTMAIIAVDEAAHAQLAWDVDHWFAARLDSAAVAAVAERRGQAVLELLRESERPIEPALIRAAGLPAPGAARWLAAQAAESLWA